MIPVESTVTGRVLCKPRASGDDPITAKAQRKVTL